MLVGSHLISVDNAAVATDMDMALAVRMARRPFVIRFAKKRRIAGPSRAGRVWRLNGGIRGSKWKQKALHLSSEGVLTCSSVRNEQYMQELCLGDCVVVGWRDEAFTRKHSRNFGGDGAQCHFFVVQHEDYNNQYEIDEEAPDPKAVSTRSWVLCVEDEEDYAAWMRALHSYA